MNSSYNISYDEKYGGIWIQAPLLDCWMSAWLQAKDADGRGWWVQFDSEGPYRLVKKVRYRK